MATEDLELHQMDVKTAFLNANADREIYVRYPPGFPSKDPRYKVLRVCKGVYGLKQAPRLWNAHLAKFLLDSGWTRLIKDTCVFLKTFGATRAYIGVYGDDITILAANSR